MSGFKIESINTDSLYNLYLSKKKKIKSGVL